MPYRLFCHKWLTWSSHQSNSCVSTARSWRIWAPFPHQVRSCTEWFTVISIQMCKCGTSWVSAILSFKGLRDWDVLWPRPTRTHPAGHTVVFVLFILFSIFSFTRIIRMFFCLPLEHVLKYTFFNVKSSQALTFCNNSNTSSCPIHPPTQSPSVHAAPPSVVRAPS